METDGFGVGAKISVPEYAKMIMYGSPNRFYQAVKFEETKDLPFHYLTENILFLG